MTEQIEQLDVKLAKWNEMERRVQEDVANVPSVITLNVGGTIFQTAKDTLLRVEGSYFHALLGSGMWNPTPGMGGAYFLDLDPVVFRRVLLFLRTGKVSTDGLNDLELTSFKSMMEYFQLHDSITKAPGVVQDRASPSGLYAASMECHWQISSTQANTVVELTFDLLNLVQYRGSNNDVLLVNLGSSKPGASIPKGWAAYRRHQVSAGTDDIGAWDYTSSNGGTNVCPATSFDPVTTDLTTGSLLTDPQRNLTWIYFTGAYTPDADNAMTLTSSASDVYIVFRSLPLYFVLSWRVVPSYCAPATVLSPRVDVSDTITTSASYTVQDNVVGQMQPNITCVWHLQPFRLDANPDCDAIGETNQPKLCTPSTSTAAYSGSQGKLSTGECLFCTLPPSLPGNSTFFRSENVINFVAPKSLPMVTWDGDYIEQSYSLTALAPLVAVPTLTKDSREACIFPFTLPLRDCTAFESYVATKAYNAAAFVAVAKPYAYATLDQLVQPCQCNTMPPWNTSNYVITRVNSTAPPSVTVQITYNYIKTQVTAGGPQINQCASQCFFIENTIQGPPLTPALPFNSSANATFVSGTTAKRYTMTREFMFQQDAHNIWQVVGTDVARTERCVVEGPDEAVVATSVSVFSCQTIGGSASDPPYPQPYCVLQNTKKTCLAEQNGCGIENGQVVYTSTGGSFEDGYESSSVTDGVHECTFNIYPAIHPKALEPFAVLTYVVPKSQLGQGDVLAVTTSIGTSANLISGSTVRTLMQREAEFTLSTTGDKSGTPGDGFIVEFDTVYSFPTAPTAHFCSNAVTTLSFQDSVVFPTYSFDNSTLVLSPNSISNCDFILQAANASAGSVVWVQFLSLALTSDRIDLFDLNADSTPSSLLATITSTSYSVEHSAVDFNGATDYLVSDMPVEVPSSILFWIQVASTLTADCTVASACLTNNIPKPMKVLGSDNHFPGFNVVLAPDTGVLSVQFNTGRSFSLLFDVRLSSWLHVAIVRRNSDLFGYIDGTLVPVASAATTSNATTTPTISQGLLYIGGQPSLPDATNIYFSGQLRHVVLFSEPKTVFEINRQMNLPCEASDVSLVVCYSFQTRLDLSRFANHLHFHGPSILQSSALVLSHNLRKIFTANSSKVLLRYSSPTSSATTDTFRLVAWSTFCVVPCFGDCDDRGHCVCRPGTSGRHCNVTIPPCSNHVIVPEGSGTITLPSPSSTVVRDHHFVPDISSRGGFGALVDCSWHIQQSNSIVMLDMQLVDLTDDNVILSMYDGDRVAPMYTSAYNLSAAMAMDRAAFFSRGQVQYTQAVIRNISSTVALATLWPSTFNASACSKVYHVVTFERGKVCADASAVGLSRRLASETIATFWWTLSSSAYASVLTTSQLYFNSFDQNSANITVEYHLRPIDARSNADTSPYPALFRLRRRTSSFSTCKDGSDVNLDGLSGQLAEFTSVLRPDLGTSGYTDQCLVTPLFDYTGNWAIDASKLYYGAFRTKFVLDQVQSIPFTMVVQAEVVLTTKDQYIFSQENQAVGSIFLKFAPTTKASGVWIFGTVGQNDGVASTNPTSFTGESVHLAITVVSGVWTYYVNGVRHSTLNTVTNYQTCVATGRASCQLPILTFSDVQNRLVIGATVSNGQGDGFWIGTIQRVKVYKSALSEAIIGCLAGGSRATVIQSTVVNAVASSTNSTTATLSTIDITTVTVQATSVISRLVREWTLVRSPCQVPPTSLQLDGNVVAYMLNVPDVQLSSSLVWNSFDDTLAQLSWRNGSFFSQSTLKRSKRYGFGLTTELIVRLLTEYGNLVENTPYHITRLYVNSVGPTGAVVSFTLANVFRSSVDAKATLVRFNDTWLVPASIERLVPPDFGVVPPVKCISSTNFTASAGYFSDGQPTETSPSVHDTLCKWEIQAPPAQTIRLQLDLFNIDCTEGVLLLVDLDTAVSTALCGNLTTRSITLTSHSSIPLIPFQSTKSSAEIRFQSQGRGGRSRVVVAYSTRKVYYVAPPSYRPADGSMGDGSLDAPFTTAFADLFANVLSDGDLLRLFPGRYSGSSYCNLVVTKAVGVDSIGGPDRTIVDCLGTFRGWQLAHVRGLTTITGITFTQCTVCIHVHTFGESSRILHQVAYNVHGAALWISGPTVLHQCRFVHNTDGIGIVAVVAPSASRLVDCEFELNVGRSALAILSATVTVADSRFLNNTSTGTEEIVVVTRYEGTGGANVLGNAAYATVSNCTFARNSGAAALGLKFSSNAVVTNCSFLSNQAGGITVFAAMLVFRFNSAQDNNTTSLLGTVGGSITSSWNVFDSNRADYGGAVFVTAATSFLSNSAGPDSSTTDFATTFTGGAISFQNGAHIDFKSNLFRGNSASTAGGASTFPA
ncbi:hypothetical protein DYB37_007085 [Aphanomyces astaci]|uniref:CUB domain-containing protein n=2 Tax=Aphanomyces astaci TaxID=112090 RepID=A0A3R6YNK2_APHAT|nr:hypothetical protein DYB37_007085 [Aphanomyces astaci]